MVSPDPLSEDDYVCEEREGCIYHIEFLGKQHTHNWIIEEKVFTKSGSKCVSLLMYLSSITALHVMYM